MLACYVLYKSVLLFLTVVLVGGPKNYLGNTVQYLIELKFKIVTIYRKLLTDNNKTSD